VREPLRRFGEPGADLSDSFQLFFTHVIILTTLASRARTGSSTGWRSLTALPVAVRVLYAAVTLVSSQTIVLLTSVYRHLVALFDIFELICYLFRPCTEHGAEHPVNGDVVLNTSRITLRQILPGDSQKLSLLYQASPDTGRIQIAPRYNLDPYSAFTALRPDAAGIVAQTPDSDELVGAGFVHFGQCYFESELQGYATLSGVVVHPDYRRQGIASRLAKWRVEHARKRLGEGGLILTAIQRENAGSFAVARMWSKQFVGQIVAGAVSMRGKPPTPIKGISFQSVQQDQLEAAADGMNAFYSDYNLYEPHTAESLRDWVNRSPFETPINHYYVATNQAGDILAGAAVTEQYRTMEMEVKRLPGSLRLLNKVLKLIPPDGALKQLAISKVWFASDQLQAAQYLWETLRWQWRKKASTMTIYFDSRSPLAKVFRVPFWMPKSSLTLAVSSPILMQEAKLIYSA
jgi:GNAT superfamily N-acetyltransferase